MDRTMMRLANASAFGRFVACALVEERAWGLVDEDGWWRRPGWALVVMAGLVLLAGMVTR